MPQWLIIGISGVTCGGKTTLAQMLREYFMKQRNVKLCKTFYTINNVRLISQDDYFLPVDDLRHIWVEPLHAINFELITALDMKQMVSDVTWTMKSPFLGDETQNNFDFPNVITPYSLTLSQLSATQTQIFGSNSKHINNVENLMKFQHSEHTQYQQCNHQNQYHPNNIKKSNHQEASYIMRVNSHTAAQLRNNKLNILIIEGFMIFNQPELITLCNIKFHLHLPYEKCFERRRKRNYDPPDVTGYFEMCVWPHYENNFMEVRDRKDITFLNGEISKDKLFTYVLQRIAQYFHERCDVPSPGPQKLLGVPSCNNPPLQTCQIGHQ